MENPVRAEEWALIEPRLSGVRTMLELGNKVNPQAGLSYKDWFTRHCNIEHVSVDVNGLNGALALDLRQPLTPLEGRVFDMVTNIGTSEHVESDQHCVWKNMWDHLAVGGHLVSITPLAGDWHCMVSGIPQRNFTTRSRIATTWQLSNWVSMARRRAAASFWWRANCRSARSFILETTCSTAMWFESTRDGPVRLKIRKPSLSVRVQRFIAGQFKNN